jgi:hypothetical protein
MSGNNELTFEFKAEGKTGKGILSIRSADERLQTERLDLASADDRAKVIENFCQRYPGVDAELARQELEKLAGNFFDDCKAQDDEDRTQAALLVSFAEDAELFHNADVPYATIDCGDHRETHSVHGKKFRLWLARMFWVKCHRPPASQAMQNALAVITAKALFEGAEAPVAVRISEHDGAIFLNLCDERWRMVQVSPSGWEVVDDAPVKFVRKPGMLPLPVPERGGSLAQLRPLINASDDTTWVLACAWLIGALRGRGPYPVMAVNGEQGSAKSTLCRMFRRLIDPNEADLRSAPKDDRDLMIAASNSWIVAFDNLSTIPPALSDAICRLATGGGFATRELYTDDSEKLFNSTRPIIFNGIEELATRPDLLERAIVINLSSISEEQRKSENALWAQYDKVRPLVLGAALDAVVVALRNIASVKLSRRPRMADFAEWVVAAEPALGWKKGTFLAEYQGNREAANELALEASSVGPIIVNLMHDVPKWEGTAKELLRELETDRRSDMKTRNRVDWPKTPKALSDALRRIAPTLRRIGYETIFRRKAGGERRRLILLHRIENGSSQSSHLDPSIAAEPQATDSAPLITNPRDVRDGRDGESANAKQPAIQNPESDQKGVMEI